MTGIPRVSGRAILESRAAAPPSILIACMYLPKIYDPAAHAYRVRYAVRTILRDRFTNQGAFRSCFEMGDADEVVVSILRRGLGNPRLRAALQASRLVNFANWLVLHPEFSESYFRLYDPEAGLPRARARQPDPPLPTNSINQPDCLPRKTAP
jgi:hypothetical protein